MSKIDINKLTIKKCTMDNLDAIMEIQNIVISNFREYEKGYFLPNSKDFYISILTNDELGEIYGLMYENKMIAWIILSFNQNLINNIIKNIEESYINVTDLDGVMVLPEYRGNNLQVLLTTYIENRAVKLGKKYMLVEVTYGNDYSLRNMQKLGYSIKGYYLKNNTIKRHILIKKL